MTYAVTIEAVPPRILAAVRRRVRTGEVPRAFRPALDQVWAFLRSNPGLRTDGHNVFHYDHASGDRPDSMSTSASRSRVLSRRMARSPA